jgi:hypothetical protein
MAEVTESSEQDVRSRGNVLALLGGALAGAVAGALGRPERASGGHDGTNVLHLGEDNVAPGITRISTDTDAFALGITNDDAGFQAGAIEARSQGQRSTIEAKNFNPAGGGSAMSASSELPGGGVGDGIGLAAAGGTAVSAYSPNGIAVRAVSDTGDGVVAETGGVWGVKGLGGHGGVIGEHLGDGVGVAGTSITGTGVFASSQSGHAVGARTETGVGVSGEASQSGIGVVGSTALGTGVSGNSGQGNGVAGTCDDPQGVGTSGSSTDGIGIHAVSQNGQALRVEGRAAFTTAGSGTVPQGQNSVFVSNPAVTADSHISVTLVGDPGLRALQWLERSPGSGFTVHLSPAPGNRRPATPFTYLIVEPALA